MKAKIFLTLLFLLHGLYLKADGIVTHLFHVKIQLTNTKLIEGYFIHSGYPDYPKVIDFTNDSELQSFMIKNTEGEAGKLDKLYRKLFRVLEFESVDEWIRGHIVVSKCEPFNISKTEIASVSLISRTKIPGQEITDITDTEINYLRLKPLDLIKLKLEDQIQAVGDVYNEYVLILYNHDKRIDLKTIKSQIETEYLSQSKYCDFNEKFGVWRKIFLKYKTQLIKEEILLLEVIDF